MIAMMMIILACPSKKITEMLLFLTKHQHPLADNVLWKQRHNLSQKTEWFWCEYKIVTKEDNDDVLDGNSIG